MLCMRGKKLNGKHQWKTFQSNRHDTRDDNKKSDITIVVVTFPERLQATDFLLDKIVRNLRKKSILRHTDVSSDVE